ncbi:MAG: cell division protein SepF [bacterium]|nr:cell division protein SepF [bacterium]
MRRSLMDRILNFIGFEQVEVPEEEEGELEPLEERQPPDRGRREVAAAADHPPRTGPQLVSIPGVQKGLRVVIVEPESFDEVAGIVDHLRNRQPTIVVLEDADKELARRVIDFVSGATYALQGVTRRVSPGVFLFAPPNVDVAAPREEEKEE